MLEGRFPCCTLTDLVDGHGVEAAAVRGRVARAGDDAFPLAVCIEIHIPGTTPALLTVLRPRVGVPQVLASTNADLDGRG